MANSEHSPDELRAYFEAITETDRALTWEEVGMMESMLPDWGVDLHYTRARSAETAQNYSFSRQLPRGFMHTDPRMGQMRSLSGASEVSTVGTLGEFDRYNLTLKYSHFPTVEVAIQLGQLERFITAIAENPRTELTT